MTVACLTVGSRLAHDGAVWTVVSLSGDRVTIEDQVARQTRCVGITHLLSAPGSRLLDLHIAPPQQAVGPLLANLDQAQLTDLIDRAAHIRELTTGYRSGNPTDALPGEPRAAYRPGVARMDRYQAKALELGVPARTMRRWAAAFERVGEAGLVTHATTGPRIRCGGSIRAGLTSSHVSWMSMSVRAGRRGSCCLTASTRA